MSTATLEPVARSLVEAAWDEARALDAAGNASAAIVVLRDLSSRRPNCADLQLRLGQLLRVQGDVEAAAVCFRRAHACDPQRVEPLLGLGAMLVCAGDGGQAEPVLRRCCALAPTDTQAHHAWGLSLMLLGRHSEAFDVLVHAHAQDPAHALCGVHLAETAHALGRGCEMLGVFEAENARMPDIAGVLTARAAMLVYLGRRDEAVDVLEAATILEPSHRVAAAMFADMLARTTRQEDAERALRHALALDSGNQDASMALSVVLMRLHRHADAVDVLQDLLRRTTHRTGPLCNLATALVALGQQDDAVALAHEAMALSPGHAAPLRALCNALPYAEGVRGADLLAAAKACGDRQPRAALPRCRTSPEPSRRLRIGLLSGSLRAHPVGWLTVAAFEALDPAGFEIICLSQTKPADAIGKRFSAIAASWEDTASLDDLQLAQFARKKEIDIVIDLGGYGDMGRMTALAYRLAPVQIKWVGMQNHSSGLAEMDWFVTDRWETPARFAGLYSERLLTMPDGYVCYAPPPYAPRPSSLPALERGHITFGCFNNLAKITPTVIDVWSQILRSVPDAQLLLKAHQFNNAHTRATLTRGFSVHGIGAERLELRGSSGHPELLRQYHDVDIVLDPFPYSGGLTTCEALWMGVPTLTMPGETFSSRHSASHLSNVGLADWVVEDIAQYIGQAVARASDLQGLAALRAGLRDVVAASPLCDAPRFGDALGSALRRIWHDWCGSKASAAMFTID
jgi:protein O-GlcNAc transferase